MDTETKKKVYHVNPETGRPNLCTAKYKCNFDYSSDEHFETKEQARKFYEKMKDDETFFSAKKNHISDFSSQKDEDLSTDVDIDKDVDTSPEENFYDIDAIHLDKVKDRIEKANKRLEKNGIEERFSVEIEEYQQIVKKDGLQYFVDRAKVKLNRPKISYNGFTFLARVEEVTEGNFVAYSAPGIELDGWRPDSMECEHCHKPRHRSKVYVIEDADGNYKTVGGKCIELYTGMTPSGIASLEWDDIAQYSDKDWESSDNFSKGKMAYESNETLKIAYTLTKDSGYKSSSYGYDSTRNNFHDLFSNFKKTQEEIDKRNHILSQADKVDIEPIKKDIIAGLEGNDSDWAHNVRVLVNTEYVDNRSLGTLMSSMAVLHKYRTEKKDTKPWSKGFLGNSGDKVTDVKAKIRKIYWDTRYYNGNEVTVAKIEMQSEDGHKVFWTTSAQNIPEVGDEITFNATVKDQSTWKDIDSTRIKNARWKKID